MLSKNSHPRILLFVKQLFVCHLVRSNAENGLPKSIVLDVSSTIKKKTIKFFKNLFSIKTYYFIYAVCYHVFGYHLRISELHKVKINRETDALRFVKTEIKNANNYFYPFNPSALSKLNFANTSQN